MKNCHLRLHEITVISHERQENDNNFVRDSIGYIEPSSPFRVKSILSKLLIF